MRVEQVEGQDIRSEPELAGDGLEWWRVGNFPAPIRSDDVTGHASRLGESLAVIGIGRKRDRRSQEQ